MSVTAGVSDTVITIRDKLRGKIELTKVKRYRPGKPPEWANDMTTGDEFAERTFPTRRDSDIVGKQDDPRLRRLAKSKLDNQEESRADHRRQIRQAEIVSTIEENNKRQEGLDLEEQDEGVLEDRRGRIKEKVLQRLQEEALLLEEDDEEEEEGEEEEESEYDTDMEEKLSSIAMGKLVFVPTSERDTIVERERLEAEEHALKDTMRRRLEELKVETKQIVVEEIRKDEETHKNLDVEVANITDEDTDDNVNEVDEYEAWKTREIARIKKDRNVRESTLMKKEIEKVMNMTTEERREWEKEKNPKLFSGFKRKWRFMQKYYHKGVFFQSDADDTADAGDIYTSDFSAPTGEDKMDKTVLPKVMQVKHFGRRGRTKWTHLVNEDTTDWNNL